MPAFITGWAVVTKPLPPCLFCHNGLEPFRFQDEANPLSYALVLIRYLVAAIRKVMKTCCNKQTNKYNFQSQVHLVSPAASHRLAERLRIAAFILLKAT